MNDLSLLAAFLKEHGCSLGDCANAIASNAIAAGEYTQGFIDKCVSVANDKHCGDEVEVDGSNMLSVGDDGVWVSAWLWVSNEEVGITGDGDNEDTISFAEWMSQSDGRKTSPEIMAAIYEVAETANPLLLEQIWEDPQRFNLLPDIYRLVTVGGVNNPRNFFWGAAESNWHQGE